MLRSENAFLKEECDCLHASLGEVRKAQGTPEVWFPDGLSSLLQSAVIALLRVLHSAHANHLVPNSSNNF